MGMDEDGYEDGWGTEARVDRLQLAKPAAGVDDHRPPAVGSCQLRHRRGVGVGMAGHEHRDLQARGGPGHRRRPVVGQELADGHVLAVPRWTRCLPWEIWRQAGGRTRGRPAADQKHPRERDHQQAHHVDQLEQQGPQRQRPPEGRHDRRQPLIREVGNHQGGEQPAEHLAEELVEDPAPTHRGIAARGKT
jgi:hypothetical protein